MIFVGFRSILTLWEKDNKVILNALIMLVSGQVSLYGRQITK